MPLTGQERFEELFLCCGNSLATGPQNVGTKTRDLSFPFKAIGQGLLPRFEALHGSDYPPQNPRTLCVEDSSLVRGPPPLLPQLKGAQATSGVAGSRSFRPSFDEDAEGMGHSRGSSSSVGWNSRESGPTIRPTKGSLKIPQMRSMGCLHWQVP